MLTYGQNFFVTIKIILLKNTFKEALTFYFDVFILFYTVFQFELNFKQKLDPKACYFKNLEEILKTWRKIAKNILFHIKFC